MRNNIFRISISLFAVGILFRSIIEVDYFAIVFLFFLSFIYLFIFIYKIKTSKFFLFVFITIFSFSLGVVRMDVKENMKESELHFSIGENVYVEGIIFSSPERGENSTQFVVETKNKEKIITYNEHYPAYSYGDKIFMKGVLEKPKNFTGDGGKKVEWISYLAKDDIYYQMFRPKIEYISNVSSVKRGLFYIKNLFIENINKLIPEPESSLATGLVVGEKNSLGNTLLDKFRRTGIIHIIVLSGYNVTIVADSIIKTLRFLPNTIASSVGILGIILFAILTGASATIVRASIMAILVILAKNTGRIHNITNALFVAGFLMLLHNPSVLVFDHSFQLSFLATIGLIYLFPYFENKLLFITNRFQLRSIIGATLSTQLLVLPLILFISGEISIVSIPVNLLILIFVPITMLFVFLSGIIASISFSIAIPISILATIFLSYELFVVDIFSKIPFSIFSYQINSWYLVLFLYSLIFFILRKFYKNVGK